MPNRPELRKILIIGDDSSTRDTIRVLLASMEYQGVVACDMRRALSVLEQETPDVVVMDLQSAGPSPSTLDSEVGGVISRLRGRVIVVTNESCSPELSEVIKYYSVPYIRRDRLVHELCSNLDLLLRPATALRRVTHIARLVFDSFRQPLPEGARISRLDTRRFVYESGPLSVDLMFESQRDSPRILLVGQIVDSKNPDHRLERIPIVLQGRKGPIALGMSNEFGEFQFEFDLEANVTLELETDKNYWITLVSPSLDWAAKRASAG